MSDRLNKIFEPHKREFDDRAKFLSRLFGTFSEQIVSLWCNHKLSKYQDIGRPTLRTNENPKGYTLDFTLRDRSSGNLYVCEMKCEIQYQNFKYFVLSDPSQLNHHKKPAFSAFLETARTEHQQQVFVGQKPVKTKGAILIWGAATRDGLARVKKEKGFFDILTVEDICEDLRNWDCVRFKGLIRDRRDWCERLFNGLI